MSRPAPVRVSARGPRAGASDGPDSPLDRQARWRSRQSSVTGTSSPARFRRQDRTCQPDAAGGCGSSDFGDEPRGWRLTVAEGVIVFASVVTALATGFLAWLTWRLASSTAASAEASRKAAEATSVQAQLARESVERGEQQRRRAQARLISAWLTWPEEGEPPVVHVRNASGETFYLVKVKTGLEGDLPIERLGWFAQVPPGEHSIRASAVPAEAHQPHMLELVEITFGDGDGVRWVRKRSGVLREATWQEAVLDMFEPPQT